MAGSCDGFTKLHLQQNCIQLTTQAHADTTREISPRAVDCFCVGVLIQCGWGGFARLSSWGENPSQVCTGFGHILTTACLRMSNYLNVETFKESQGKNNGRQQKSRLVPQNSLLLKNVNRKIKTSWLLGPLSGRFENVQVFCGSCLNGLLNPCTGSFMKYTDRAVDTASGQVQMHLCGERERERGREREKGKRETETERKIDRLI